MHKDMNSFNYISALLRKHPVLEHIVSSGLCSAFVCSSCYHKNEITREILCLCLSGFCYIELAVCTNLEKIVGILYHRAHWALLICKTYLHIPPPYLLSFYKILCLFSLHLTVSALDLHNKIILTPLCGVFLRTHH